MLTITANLALDDAATGTQTGTVGEPSVGASSSTLFVTGNWYATRSADRGATWSSRSLVYRICTVQRGLP